ncbi:PIN domain-containing protein [Saccharopolyspora elongata]|uniref:PIN domain-containing protein n=1 Tax=Saccharopolyspora elongata TaxID=2530387 RepID=UPI00269BCFF3
MIKAVRDCLVMGYEPLIDAVELPDPDDRHVLAAAIKARAQVVVTANLKDAGLNLSAYTAEPGSPSAEALLLASWAATGTPLRPS